MLLTPPIFEREVRLIQAYKGFDEFPRLLNGNLRLVFVAELAWIGNGISLCVDLPGYRFEFLDCLRLLLSSSEGNQEAIRHSCHTVLPVEQGVYACRVAAALRLKFFANSEVSRQLGAGRCANDGGGPFLPSVKAC
jgi:hypothetical protein